MFQLRLIILTIMLLFFSGSCGGPAAPPVASAPSPSESAPDESAEIERQSRIIIRLTDEVLKTLATNNYPRLEQLIDSSEFQLSGAQAAGLLIERLIGRRASSIILSSWDAREIKVSFADDLLRAAAEINLSYRLSLNRKPQTALFTFYFYRPTQQDVWRLVVW
ncbi:hypothetical protein ACFL02_04460 [Planctomycetota bacterium]